MTGKADSTWWALACSEEVTNKKPLSVDIGDQPIVLWRDKEGQARALEDRCPHRRAPLSLGRVRENGWLQCGYHGWSYDGATGRLCEIPNMKDDQRFPPLYRAERFAVSEAGGFVRVNLDPNAAPPDSWTPTLPQFGTSHVATDRENYLAALYDAPELVLDIRGVHFTPYLMSELHEEDGKLVMERSCQWKGLRWPAPFTADFPITVLTRSDPVTGETELTLRDAEFNDLVTAIVAPVAAARGVTAIRWRSKIGTALKGFPARLLGFGHPFSVRNTIDAAALRQLKPSVSRHGEDLLATLTDGDASAA